MAPPRPETRHGFRIGIICALPLEAEMVEAVFDKKYKREERFGKAPNDPNTYTTGVIAGHNVVLAYCPSMGGNAAAQVASSLMSSFTGVEITFVTGICGAVPFHKNKEIVLGDCLISTAVIQGDFGRVGPGGFARKDGLEGLGRAGNGIRSLLNKMQTWNSRRELTHELGAHLSKLQELDASYPGALQDCLYESDYIHTHDPACSECDTRLGLCKRDCSEIGCLASHLVPRERLLTDATPSIHFGTFASSNSVIRSGRVRDEHAQEDIIAFEMEGSGVWDVCPTIVIKAACDYADSHKQKKWQRYAAAVAAAGLKAFLEEVELPDLPVTQSLNIPIRPRENTPFIVDNIIHRYYNSRNRLCIERLSGTKLALDKCYINLALVDHTTLKQERETFMLESRLRLNAETIGICIPLGSLFDYQRLSDGTTGLPKRIFIQGRAGIGKTTLCKKLVYEYLGGRLGSKLFDRILWVPLRRLKQNQSYSWQDLLQDTFALQEPEWRRNCQSYSEQFYDPSFLERTLLLFDGLDEISHGWREDDPFYDFIAGIICDSTNIIITSRPQAKTFDPGRFDLELETTGFLPQQIDEYVENCIDNDSTISDMKAFIESRPLVQSLLRIPIQLDAFCYTWPRLGASISGMQLENISTMTTLYHAISLELCRKDLKQLRANALPREMSDSEVLGELSKELKILGEIAFQGILNNVNEFNPLHCDTIVSHMERYSTPVAMPYSAILDRLSFLRTSDIEQSPSRRNYHFLHLTFQEFFAARHFVDHWLCDTEILCLDLTLHRMRRLPPMRLIQADKYNPRLNIFWRFVTGLIQLQAEHPGSDSFNGQNNLTCYFEQLEGPPIDLIGSVQERLLLHCLSEVAVSGYPEARQLRQRLENSIYNMVVDTSRRDGSIDLCREPEFPDSVLQRLLSNVRRISSDLLPVIMTSRSRFNSMHECLLLNRLAHLYRMNERVAYAMIACKVWEGDPEELLSRITPLCKEIGEYRSSLENWKSSLCLIRPRHPHIAEFLFIKFQDKDEEKSVRRVIGCMLNREISPQHFVAVAAILGDDSEDLYIRECAGRMLYNRNNLDGYVIDTLVALLSSDSEIIWNLVLDALDNQVLSAEAAFIVNTVFMKEDRSEWLRVKAFHILQKSNITEDFKRDCMSIFWARKGLTTLRYTILNVLSRSIKNAFDAGPLLRLAENEEETYRIRSEAFLVLLSSQPPYPGTVPALVKAIRTYDPGLEWQKHYVRPLLPLPSKLKAAMISEVREGHRRQLQLLKATWWQAFTLPNSIVKMLVEIMQRIYNRIGSTMTDSFAYQPHFSVEVMRRFATIADSHSDSDRLMETLHRRDIYSGLTNPGTRLWKNLVTYWLSPSTNIDVSCYEFEGLLYIWFNGNKHQITTTQKYSAALLKIIQDSRI